jgi:hypothetical protein
MNGSEIRPEQAAEALAEIRTRQERVFAGPFVPGWYWPAVGGLQVAFSAGVESRRPVLVAVATMVFAVGIAGAVLLVVLRARMTARNALIGRRGAVAIGIFVAVNLALGLGTAFGLGGLGVAYPGTIGSAVVAVSLIVLGPVLGRRLRRIMRENAARDLG